MRAGSPRERFYIHCCGVVCVLCPEELAVSVTAAAITISKSLSALDTALISAVFTQLGDTLATIAAAKDKLENCLENQGEKNGDSKG